MCPAPGCRGRSDGEKSARTTGECGFIISTASIAAYDGQIGRAAYSAFKGGGVA